MRNKTYYEILGVSPHVGSGQIQSAYRFARGLYCGEAAATSGLLSAEERSQMLTLVEEAYAALSNPNVRRDYDIHLSDARTRVSIEPPAPPVEASRAPSTAATAAVVPRVLVPEEPVEPLKVPELVNGAVLRMLRESRRLSIDQISALSKVGARFLSALEEDRHAALPGRVFARGFLIEYARALRVPESEIVERYLRHWTAN